MWIVDHQYKSEVVTYCMYIQPLANVLSKLEYICTRIQPMQQKYIVEIKRSNARQSKNVCNLIIR